MSKLSREDILASIWENKKRYLSPDSDKETKESSYKDWIKNCNRLIDKANTLDDYRKAYFISPDGSRPKKTAFNNWNKKARILACQAKTPAEARNAQRNSPPESEAGKLALTRRIKLCSTPALAKEELRESESGSPEAESLLFRWIDVCTTENELDEVLGGLRPKSVARKAVLEKLEKLKPHQVNQESSFVEVNVYSTQRLPEIVMD